MIPKLLNQIVPWHITFCLSKCFLTLCRDGYIQAQYAHECTVDLWQNPEQFELGQTMAKDQNLETNLTSSLTYKDIKLNNQTNALVLKMDVFNVFI